MLEIGNGWLTYDQEKTHFALWAAAKAPLILGCDLDKISPDSLSIITNEELIAINQDALGV
jgi:alpha-galactosidase